MYISCPYCGGKIWLETQFDCRHCGRPARRCIDCVNYNMATRTCGALGLGIGEPEDAKPGVLSTSYRCSSYRPRMRLIVRP